MKDLMNGIELKSNQCIVAISERGEGYILAQSDYFRDRDVLMEETAEDNGFNDDWDKGLSVGIYLLTIKPWADKGYDGEWDDGIDVLEVKPLWIIEELK